MPPRVASETDFEEIKKKAGAKEEVKKEADIQAEQPPPFRHRLVPEDPYPSPTEESSPYERSSSDPILTEHTIASSSSSEDSLLATCDVENLRARDRRHSEIRPETQPVGSTYKAIRAKSVEYLKVRSYKDIKKYELSDGFIFKKRKSEKKSERERNRLQ